MVVGIGTDIVRIDRIQRSLDKLGDRFAERVLTPDELEQFQRASKPATFLAKRFAVKEAASKALGTGIGNGVSFQHIFVEHDPLGAPLLRLRERALAIASERGASDFLVTLSDEKDYVVAFVVLSARA
ncbi:holo-ACP synthase [Aestuariirhabdus litorea]|uniref:Holo-[acyl-carrier-protein] synthase n=1 Tax=Aestuariirhabdus litorea TaxID=2528527 RepID=A0A3P3VT43_9GAMM|nr:holo-ACP synthase [Aestuariirhabdus litorea]RRJ85148.1 holo-ACP synthase [Aestuariirhabdus litorea]RWW98371.1 holo-ACP synthase [Endozoicomonadaceae bacterium GTF-13]